ncbi:SusC/RagA family TonB-linked outer membrane protein [uncultured Bacteroides sp.]|jgi:TonB-linked SusC/RagA family outer membrane protein|uniref:SusC/RagA family TonB-linked outer membrane protein n=1 Tax=uncultured Bacteroides sp. TaxID=162156 RepID=UPI00280B3668|nr:SusC/RagA family TonB-linked outer membrane protein [uncultured Bacteroides sp.]
MKKTFWIFRQCEMRYTLCVLCLFLCSVCLFAQSKKVTGRVTDVTGEPIIGANVLVKGTTHGVISDLDGSYSLDVEPGAILQFSYIGYISQEISVDGRSTINVQMKEDTKTIEEVVVVGYGSQKKETLTGSVANIKGDEITKSPAPNVSSSLSGKLPGLVVNQRTGEPGRDDPNIVIRGFGTFGDSSPLIIIDGVERDNMSRMNPEDIESISVLKDASAAIYGARAANGVILITTKKGKIGKPEFSFNMNVAFSSPTVKPEMLDAATFAEAYNEGDWYRKGRPSEYTPVYTDEVIQKYRDGSDPILYPNTNWVDETLRPFSLQTRSSFQVNGGTESVRYLLSFGSLTQGPGYYHQNEKNRQYTFRANVNVDLSRNLTVGANISAIINNQQHSSVETWINFTNILESSPLLVARYPNGLLGGGRMGESPLLLDQRGFDKISSTPIYSTFTATYKVPWVEGLKIEGSFNYDINNKFEKLFQIPYYYYEYNEDVSK